MCEPWLAHEHDSIDGRCSPIFHEHARTLACRRTRRHHIVEQQDACAAQHPRGESQRERPPHGGPAQGLGPATQLGEVTPLDEERGPEIVAAHSGSERRRGIEIDRRERMDWSPPPMSAGRLAEWCGARKGRMVMRDPRTIKCPATL